MLFTALFLNMTYRQYRKWEEKTSKRFGVFFAAFALFLLVKAV